jgi:hypothetical protein
MPRAVAVAGRVGDFVELIAASRKPEVRKSVLFGVALVVGRRRSPAGDPTGERSPRFDGETVERKMERAK